MIRAKPRRNSVLNPEKANHGGTSTTVTPPGLARAIDPAPLGPNGILLANVVVM